MRAPVLLVGYDAAAVRRTRDDFISGGLTNPVLACEDGHEAAAYVLGRAPYAERADHPLPVVLVTTLRLPLGSAAEVLRVLRADAGLRLLPVVVTGGDPGDDEIAVLHRHGATYLSGHVAARALLDVIRGLNLPWALERAEPVA